jgi:hypothetical protein
MPQVLILIAAGAAGVVLAGRWYSSARRRVLAELRAAQEAMERQKAETIVPLEQDPRTGIYRPKRTPEPHGHGARR